uniref:Large ribosomal subunit protein bL27m n=1 Tax=Nannospalax galili TaxID=1026970 RepID=A0A8C6QTF6_NANGA
MSCSLQWGKAKDFQVFPKTTHLALLLPSHISFPLSPLSLASVPQRQRKSLSLSLGSSLSSISVLSVLTALLNPSQASSFAVRYASKKTGGSSKNLGGKSIGKRYGIKKMEGHYVHAGNILGTQRQFRWHPGAHVGLGKNKCLYALEEGIVRYTKEVYVPNPQNLEAVDLVTRLPKGAVLYKTFVHVVPAKPEGTFKLAAML